MRVVIVNAAFAALIALGVASVYGVVLAVRAVAVTHSLKGGRALVAVLVAGVFLGLALRFLVWS